MVANTSDIAAMGGLPKHALVSICLPETVGIEDVDRIYQGMQAVADEHGFGIVGGDTVSSPREIVLSIFLTGTATEGDLMLRGGAREGDLICVTGELGGSQAGLAMLQAELMSSDDPQKNLPQEKWSQVRNRHLQPRPRLKEARLLAQTGCVHAMIDVSDGLAGDVGHILEESGVGAEIRQEDIPIGSQTHLVAQHLGGLALNYALHGGEDFELIFAVGQSDAERICGQIQGQTGTPVSIIGKILPAESGVVLISPEGQKTKLITEGYRHF
jgi:thiamine-monophosphate kinase